MKRVLMIGVIFCALTALFGCAGQRLVTIVGQPDIPSFDSLKEYKNDEAKRVLVQNQSPFWVRIYFRDETLILGPGKEREMVHMDGLRALGNFSFYGYAYRHYDGKRLYEFVGEQQFSFYLSGYPQVWNGRVFGAVVTMYGFPVSQFRYPVQFNGVLLDLVPFSGEVR